MLALSLLYHPFALPSFSLPSSLRSVSSSLRLGNHPHLTLPPSFHRSPSPFLPSLLFWTDWGDHATISRATMAGSNPVHIVSTHLRWPNGVALDGDRIYWTDAFFDRIESAKLNGDDRVVLLSQGVPHPYAIAIYKVL